MQVLSGDTLKTTMWTDRLNMLFLKEQKILFYRMNWIWKTHAIHCQKKTHAFNRSAGCLMWVDGKTTPKFCCRGLQLILADLKTALAGSSPWLWYSVTEQWLLPGLWQPELLLEESLKCRVFVAKFGLKLNNISCFDQNQNKKRERPRERKRERIAD